jgi:hypothetical protein
VQLNIFRANAVLRKIFSYLDDLLRAIGAKGRAGKRAFKWDDRNRPKVNLIMVKPLQFPRLARHERDKANCDEFFASKFPTGSLG